MFIRFTFFSCLLLVLGGGLLFAEPVSQQSDRSPISLAVSPDGQFIATANHTSSSVSLIHVETGRVVSELNCGRGPADILWVADQLIVSLQHEDAVVFLSTNQDKLRVENKIIVGDAPRGLAAWKGASGRIEKVFVASSGFDRIEVLDLQTQNVTHLISVGGEPRMLAVSPNQKWLVTCCSIPGEVFVHDASTFQLISKRTIFDDAFNLGRPTISPDSLTVFLSSSINRTFPIDDLNIEKGWAIDNRLTKLPLPQGEYWEQKQMGLDVRGDAVGDPMAVKISQNGKTLVVACGGTHELLILNRSKILWPAADPGDFLPDALRDNEDDFRRVELGGRPTDIEFVTPTQVAVSNYLLNSVQIVEITSGKILKTIYLGGPAEPSLARQGEMIFYDADRSFDSWFSCQTCHTDGHTSGQTFDTLNDGNYDTFKLTPTLRGVMKTGPWTWHGWQTDLPAAVRKSMQATLSSPKPVSDHDVEALLAYFKSLKIPESPHRTANKELTKSAVRGQTLFLGKAGCADCHRKSQNYTSPSTYSVGLESNRYFFPEFNPPSLNGLHTRRRFLHDGRASSLQEVLTRYHRSEKLTGRELTEPERRDLIDFLMSL